MVEQLSNEWVFEYILILLLMDKIKFLLFQYNMNRNLFVLSCILILFFLFTNIFTHR